MAYWDDRISKLNEEVFKDSDLYVRELRKFYDEEINQIQNKIYNHLTKLQAEAGGISLPEAKKLLNDRERKLLKSDLEDFMEKSKGVISPDIEKELNTISRRVRISRLQGMELDLKKSVAGLMTTEEKKLFAHLGRTYERRYYKELYELQRITGYESVREISQDELKIVLNKPWTSDGREFSKRIWGRGEKLTASLKDNLIRDIIRGASPEETAKNIKKEFNASKANAIRLAYTETAAISSKATQDSYKNIGVKKYQILATLDLKTSDICRDMDGKIFDYKDYRIGITAPPFHPNCRTETVPYFDDDIQREIDNSLGRMARDPETGKSGRTKNLTYKEWYSKYVAESNDKKMINFKEISEEFVNSKKVKGEKVENLPKSKYKIIGFDDGYSLAFDHGEHEKNIANWLANEIGGKVYLCPRVLVPEKIRTPDYIWENQKWDLKNITSHGKNTINNAINNTKNQSNNVILNLIDTSYKDEDIYSEMERIFSNSRYNYIRRVLIVEDYKLRNIFKRN